VDKPLVELRGSYAAKYIKWGEKQTFASKKSKAVTVPERSSCSSRPIWYNLTGAGTGNVFWPMAQKYRHIVPGNPDKLHCNHNLFYLAGRGLSNEEDSILPAILNCTFIALIKHFYGRYAGSEKT
jgi:hypothetical protein